jgi:hypothetical protein
MEDTMSSYSFPHQFISAGHAPEPIRNAIIQELTDIPQFYCKQTHHFKDFCFLILRMI